PASKSADLQQLDFKQEGCIRRNHAAGAARAVAERGRDGEQAGTADLHALYAFVPALDHHAGAERETGPVAAVLARVELAAVDDSVGKPAGVVHSDVLAFGRGVAAADLDILDLQPAGRGGSCHELLLKTNSI